MSWRVARATVLPSAGRPPTRRRHPPAPACTPGTVVWHPPHATPAPAKHGRTRLSLMQRPAGVTTAWARCPNPPPGSGWAAAAAAVGGRPVAAGCVLVRQIGPPRGGGRAAVRHRRRPTLDCTPLHAAPGVASRAAAPAHPNDAVAPSSAVCNACGEAATRAVGLLRIAHIFIMSMHSPARMHGGSVVVHSPEPTSRSPILIHQPPFRRCGFPPPSCTLCPSPPSSAAALQPTQHSRWRWL